MEPSGQVAAFADLPFIVGFDQDGGGQPQQGLGVGEDPDDVGAALDARYLRDAQHADAMLCRLVAHHSCAIIEAGERGLADVLSLEFEPAPYALSSALTCCDMTTRPDGELVPVEQRLAEIQDHYGPGHLVSRSIQRATPMILGAVKQAHNRAAHIA